MKAWTSPEGWLLHAALGGGLVLWLTWWLVQRTSDPARQQRLAEVGVAVALLAALLAAGPAWLTLSVPLPWSGTEPTVVADTVPAQPEVVAPEEPGGPGSRRSRSNRRPRLLQLSLRWELPDPEVAALAGAVSRRMVVAGFCCCDGCSRGWRGRLVATAKGLHCPTRARLLVS
jgi:hypothetical protein